MSTLIDNPAVDAAEIRSAMEYYQAKGWSDGLPVVPVTESYLKSSSPPPAASRTRCCSSCRTSTAG